jgi:general secretion pathway protein H
MVTASLTSGSVRRARQPGGFTLIETLVVLVVIALAIGLVAMRGPGHSARLELDGAARDVAGLLRMARAQAIAHDRAVAVLLDPTAHVLRIDGTLHPALPAAIGVRLVPPPSGGNAIVFAPDGSASGGRIDLVGKARTVTVNVDWLTGRVTVAERAADASS